MGSGGIVRRQAVDVSPFRRVNQAVYLMAMGECHMSGVVPAGRALKKKAREDFGVSGGGVKQAVTCPCLFQTPLHHPQAPARPPSAPSRPPPSAWPTRSSTCVATPRQAKSASCNPPLPSRCTHAPHLTRIAVSTRFTFSLCRPPRAAATATPSRRRTRSSALQRPTDKRRRPAASGRQWRRWRQLHERGAPRVASYSSSLSWVSCVSVLWSGD